MNNNNGIFEQTIGPMNAQFGPGPMQTDMEQQRPIPEPEDRIFEAVEETIQDNEDSRAISEFENDTPNYLKLGGVTYALARVEGAIDIGAESRAYYLQKYNRLMERMRQRENLAQDDEFMRQVDRLRRLSTNSMVVLPNERMDKPCYYDSRNKDFVSIRCINYYPHIVSISIGELRYQPSITGMFTDEQREEFLELSNSVKVEITLKHHYRYPLMVGIGSHYAYTLNIKTFHTFDDKRMCMGNYKIEDYLNANDKTLEDMYARINMFSLATSEIRNYDTNERLATTNDIFTNSELISISRQGGWRV